MGKYKLNKNGSSITDTVVNLRTGWNLIGCNSYNYPTENLYTIPPGILSTDFYGYDSAGYYISPEHFQVGKRDKDFLAAF